MMDFALKMMKFVFKMIDFASGPLCRSGAIRCGDFRLIFHFHWFFIDVSTKTREIVGVSVQTRALFRGKAMVAICIKIDEFCI